MSDDAIADNSRRHFVSLGAIGLAVAPFGSLLVNRTAEARGSSAITRASTEIPKLPENDRQAIALGYREDAALVDTTTYKKGEDNSCRNC